MVFRHALVVGSQCDELANQPLSFLPDRAHRLFEVLTDGSRGGCEPAPVSVLLLDPTLAELEVAVETAVNRAAEAQATLVFAFIGHAETAGYRNSGPLFLMPRNGNHSAPTSKTAYELGHSLGETNLAGLDGLILLLDACHAGAGVRDVIKAGLDLKEQPRLALLAGTFLRVARNGCFSESLVNLMGNGRPDLSVDYLNIEHAANTAFDACQAVQDPPVLLGSGVGRPASDPGLWVTRNVASPDHWLLSGTAEGALAVALTESFQATHHLERITQAMSHQRLVVIQGGGGSGKSAVVAALARPELVPDLPRRYLSAVVFTALTPTLVGMAESLGRQLAGTPGFAEAATAYGNSFTTEELDRQPALSRLVFGPLTHLTVPLGKRLRLAIDGIDQLEPAVRSELLSTVAQASGEDRLQRVSILLSTRGHGVEELGVEPILLARPGADEIAEYLTSLKLPALLASDLEANAATWLQLRLLTDVATALGGKPLGEVADLDDLYRQLLSSLAEENNSEARVALSVLAVLGAAGVGPVLPVSLAARACFELGMPEEVRFHHVVSALGPLIARADPGTPEERLGLFHETLAQHIQKRFDSVRKAELTAIAELDKRGLDPEENSAEYEAAWPEALEAATQAVKDEHEEVLTVSSFQAHDAILRAMEALKDDYSQAYRRQRRTEHLWAVERYEEAIEDLRAGLGYRAADNRDSLQGWAQRAGQVLPAEHPTLLSLKMELAFWTGEAGGIAEAVRQYHDLLEDQQRILGPDDPETLITRTNIASLRGGSDDSAEALRQVRDLLADQLRVLGPDHPYTMAARTNLASLIAQSGDTAEALRQLRDLLADELRVLGPNHPYTLAARRHLAHWTGESGDMVEALRQCGELLQDELRVLGPDHPDTLITRGQLASFIGRSGDSAEAVRQCGELLGDQLRVLGPDHPDTLTTREKLAYWSAESGDMEAVRHYGDLLKEQLRLLGPEHPVTLATRGKLEDLSQESGGGEDVLGT